MENEISHIKNNIILNSKEYQKDLKKLTVEIVNKCKKADNEATVASSFENSIYHFIRQREKSWELCRTYF